MTRVLTLLLVIVAVTSTAFGQVLENAAATAVFLYKRQGQGGVSGTGFLVLKSDSPLVMILVTAEHVSVDLGHDFSGDPAGRK